MPGSDWLRYREQDLVDLCQKWKIGLANAANGTAFGWKQAEVAAVMATGGGSRTGGRTRAAEW